MPVNVKKGESENDFISRCIGEEVSAGYSQEQSAAICYSYWEKDQNMKKVEDLKKAVKDIKNFK
jgi:hypothetical protein